jgi:glutamate-1-semialdehyde 2,1-aminomutase
MNPPLRTPTGDVPTATGEGAESTPEPRFALSFAQHARARRTLAGGVATAIRAGQLPVPITFERASGARLWDVDGNEYVDYTLAYGPMLLGHSPRAVVDAVRRQLETGIGYGASHRFEAELAEAVCRTVPSAELCVFGSTGSEAVHTALRIARAATGRLGVIKCVGHYHGWFDTINVEWAGDSSTRPATKGQDPAAAASVSFCAWNDLEMLRAMLTSDVAAVIMEPLSVNAGCFAPDPGYLAAAAELVRSAGALLIFDEVITGFRLALGGAQERFGVTPDLTVLGKALAGGFPISAVCGRADVMQAVVSGEVAHIGTFNANPICAAAAVAAIGELERRADEIYPALAANANQLARILVEESADAGLPIHVNCDVGVAYAFASENPVLNVQDAQAADAAGYRRFAAELLRHGVHVPPRGLLYVSTEHTQRDLDATRVGVRGAARAAAAEARKRVA